jgi:hypothetical protein
MVKRRTLGAAVGGFALVLTTALMSVAVTSSSPPLMPQGGARWVPHLEAVDAALQAHDLRAAHRAWLAAHGAALASRRWEALVETADAHLRIAQVANLPGAPKARDLYLAALFRARDAGSREGMLRVAAAFDALGDHEVAGQARRMARRLSTARATEYASGR